MIGKAIKVVLVALIVIGVWRGIVNYQASTGDNVIARLVGSVVNTVQDLTYRWIGRIADAVQKHGSELPGQIDKIVGPSHTTGGSVIPTHGTTVTTGHR